MTRSIGTSPNPLTDELSDEDKAELAAQFAALAEPRPPEVIRRRRPNWWERYDRNRFAI